MTGLIAIATLIFILTLPLTAQTLIVAEHWIARYLAAHRERAAFEQIAAGLRADYPDLDETVRHLQQTVRPARPASPRHAIKRRRMPSVRIPRRVVRHTSTADSDRRH